jgi:peptidoglycan hydrolase-like protein with peptidoglycan-binding domain
MARDLTLGSRGQDVAQVQAALNLKLLEAPLLEMDCVFGPKTHERVLAFQRRHRLVPDGVIGPNTRAKLFAPGSVLPPQGGRPVFVRISPPDLMLIQQAVEFVLGATLTSGTGSPTQNVTQAAQAARASQLARRIHDLFKSVTETK